MTSKSLSLILLVCLYSYTTLIPSEQTKTSLTRKRAATWPLHHGQETSTPTNSLSQISVRTHISTLPLQFITWVKRLRIRDDYQNELSDFFENYPLGR